MVYLLLTLAGLTAVAVAAWQDRRPAERAATITVAAAGVILADWIAYGWFSLYTYQPHLLADQQMDCALGELLADILFVPSLAVFMATRLPETAGTVLSTFAVTALEYLFLRFDLFRHTGWATWYSAALFPGFFVLVSRLRRRLDRDGLAQPAMLMLVRGALLLVLIGLYTLGLRPLNATVTNLHLMPTQLGNQSLGRFLTYPTIFVPVGLWVVAGPHRQRWWRLAGAVAAFAVWNLVLLAAHFQFFRRPYTWYLDVVGQSATLYAACLLSDLLQRHATGAPSRVV